MTGRSTTPCATCAAVARHPHLRCDDHPFSGRTPSPEPKFHCDICGSDTHDALVCDPLPVKVGRSLSWRTVTWAGQDFGVVDHLLILNGNAWRTACATSRESGLWADGARTNPAEWGHREPPGDRPRCKLCAKKVSDA